MPLPQAPPAQPAGPVAGGGGGLPGIPDPARDLASFQLNQEQAKVISARLGVAMRSLLGGAIPGGIQAFQNQIQAATAGIPPAQRQMVMSNVLLRLREMEDELVKHKQDEPDEWTPGEEQRLAMMRALRNVLMGGQVAPAAPAPVAPTAAQPITPPPTPAAPGQMKPMSGWVNPMDTWLDPGRWGGPVTPRPQPMPHTGPKRQLPVQPTLTPMPSMIQDWSRPPQAEARVEPPPESLRMPLSARLTAKTKKMRDTDIAMRRRKELRKRRK